MLRRFVLLRPIGTTILRVPDQRGLRRALGDHLALVAPPDLLDAAAAQAWAGGEFRREGAPLPMTFRLAPEDAAAVQNEVI